MAHESGRHGAHRAAADFLQCGFFGGEEGAVAVAGFVPLAEGAGDVDPALAWRRGGGWYADPGFVRTAL
ncbi:hypothetical protein [[Kitasatospora] papulosa]|uniref:hypothetical protein n=1 Tax=[Kitasatospora] papulosa TaxID=1464011 RepID=UPI00403C75C6